MKKRKTVKKDLLNANFWMKTRCRSKRLSLKASQCLRHSHWTDSLVNRHFTAPNYYLHTKSVVVLICWNDNNNHPVISIVLFLFFSWFVWFYHVIRCKRSCESKENCLSFFLIMCWKIVVILSGMLMWVSIEYSRREKPNKSLWRDQERNR